MYIYIVIVLILPHDPRNLAYPTSPDTRPAPPSAPHLPLSSLVQTTGALLNTSVSRKRKRAEPAQQQQQQPGNKHGAKPSPSHKGGQQAAHGSSSRPSQGTPPFPPSHYVLDMKQLEANSYPRPVVGITGEMCCPDGFVATQPAATPAAQALEAGGERMVAMDCEMCITEHVSAGIEGRGVWGGGMSASLSMCVREWVSIST